MDEQTQTPQAQTPQPQTPIVEDEAGKVAQARAKLKAENDAYEAEKLRAERLRAEKLTDGRSLMNTPQLTPDEEKQKQAQEMADSIVKSFR